jgi:transposase InsO family protein
MVNWVVKVESITASLKSMVKSDNESEFKDTRVDELCDELGIKHEFSAKYTL